VKAKKRCLSLLSALGNEWPGFLSALLVQIVDAILTIGDSGVSNDAAGRCRRLFFLGSWAEYLVSRDFLVQWYKITHQSSANDKSKPTGIQEHGQDDKLLQQLVRKVGYPLNALCDRCMGSTEHSGDNATSRRLAQLFEDILADDRVRCHEAASVASVFLPEKNASKPLASAACETNFSDKLTLDEMEAILEHEEDVNAGRKLRNTFSADREGPTRAAAPPIARRAWVRCESWEPCAIGTIPGHPL